MTSRSGIRAGKLRQYATVERFVKASTGDRGQPVGAWTALYSSVPTEILPLAGKQLEISRQLVGTATHTIRLRYHSGIVPGMRVTWGSRHFNVGHVDDGDNRKHWLLLTCTEQQTGAT